MKDKIKIRWWVHALILILFVIAGAYLYHVAFLSDKSANPNDLATHQFVTILIALVACHFIWLMLLLVKLLIRRQFLPTVFIFLFGLADIGLIKVMGFLWATTIMG